MLEWVFSAKKRFQLRNWTPFAHITGVNSGLVGGVTLLSAHSAPQIAKRRGLQLSQIDFSVSLARKGAYDRKAATIKSYMAVHLNSGHDIETAAQMKEAI